jgi:hypothetical protein
MFLDYYFIISRLIDRLISQHAEQHRRARRLPVPPMA